MMARPMDISVRRVQKLCAAYRTLGEIPELKRPGRRRVEATDEENALAEKAFAEYRVNALTLERVVEVDYGRHTPHNRAHDVLRSMGLARDEPRKRLRKK